MKLIKRRKKMLAVAAVLLIAAGGGAWFIVRGDSQPPATQASEAAAEAPTETETAISPPAPPAAFDKTLYSLSDPSSIWTVVNKQRPLSPLTYKPTDLIPVGGGQLLRREAADAFSKLLAAAQAAGYTLNPLSGYRSYERQQLVYQREVDTYGQAVADTESARPGYSEHQTGFSIDVGGGGCGIEDCFGNTAHGQWLAAHAYEHGFIIRYPQGKQAVTGYRYEPWHIRYVGVDLSGEMRKQQIITLEEFFGL